MSLQRTPPATQIVQTTRVSPIFKHASNPDLSYKDNADNATARKRKQNPDVEELSCLRSDLNDWFTNLKVDNDSKYKQLNEAINELKTHNEEILKSNKKMEQTIEQTSALYNDLKDTVIKISSEHNVALQKIAALEEQLEQVQRNQLKTSLEISDLPKAENENLCELLNTIHTCLGLSIGKDDIVEVYRVNNLKKKPVVVQYRNACSRNDVLRAIKNHNKTNPKKRFCAKDANPEWKEDPIYFNESLTTNARRLFFAARNLQKVHGFKYCWTSSGRVYVRKIEGSPAIQIKSNDQIEKLAIEDYSEKE